MAPARAHQALIEVRAVRIQNAFAAANAQQQRSSNISQKHAEHNHAGSKRHTTIHIQNRQ